MAATFRLLRLNKSPLQSIIQKNLLSPSLASGTATKLFDISADSQLPSPTSASSKSLMAAEFQPTWKLPFGMYTLPVMENSRIEVRGKAINPDDEFEESDEDGDLNDFDDSDGDFTDDTDDEDGDNDDDSR